MVRRLISALLLLGVCPAKADPPTVGQLSYRMLGVANGVTPTGPDNKVPLAYMPSANALGAIPANTLNQPNGPLQADSQGNGSTVRIATLAAAGSVSGALAQFLAGRYNAATAGLLFNGSDEGAALNTFIASTPLGATVYIPANVHSSVQVVAAGRYLEMPANSQAGAAPAAIYGSATLSPVVQLSGPGGGAGCGATNLNIGRDGGPAATPAPGALGVIGLLINGCNYAAINGGYIWNQAEGIVVTNALGTTFSGTKTSAINDSHLTLLGGTSGTGGSGAIASITTSGGATITTGGVPQTTLFGTSFGRNGVTDVQSNSYIHIDGNVDTTTLVRAQLNQGGGKTTHYGFNFTNYSGVGLTFLTAGTHVEAFDTAFLNIDANTVSIHGFGIKGSSVTSIGGSLPLVTGGSSAVGFWDFSGGDALAVSANLTGGPYYISGVQFGGPVTVNAASGIISGNLFNSSLTLSGAMTGLTVGDNEITGAYTDTSTGNVSASNGTLLNSNGNHYSATLTANALTIGPTGPAGRMDINLVPLAGSFNLNAHDGSQAGGNQAGQGSVDFQTSRTAATQVPSGTNSFIAVGKNNTMAGNNSAAGGFGVTGTTTCSNSVVYGQQNNCSGANSVVLGRYADDWGRTGAFVFSSHGVLPTEPMQSTQATFIGSSSGAAVQMTADGGAPSTVNEFNLPAGSAALISMDFMCRRPSNGDAQSWTTSKFLYTRDGTASTVAITPSSPTITPGTARGVTTWTPPTIGVDSTNGGLAPFTAFQTGIVVVCSARITSLEGQ